MAPQFMRCCVFVTTGSVGLAMAKVFLLLTLVLSAALLCHSIQLDVHIEVNEESFFSNLSSQLAALLPNNEIDFRTTSLPHVTLYLTDFEDNLLPSVINGTGWVMQQPGEACPIHLTTVTVQGEYAMWDVEVTPCLQSLSNTFVSALRPYITPNQPIPDWVLTLPEPLRTEKINMIKRYGSPNVYDQFQPHVTLAWDNKEPMGPAFKKLNIQPHNFTSKGVGLGLVGPHGTVLRGKNFAYYPFAHRSP